MFVDETTITVKAGDGGNGCFAYLREKYRPKGGPSGGTGGDGGNIFIHASHHLRTLQDVNYRKRFNAESGAHGKGGHKHGKDAEDITVLVPIGTLVQDAGTGAVLFDAVDEKKIFLAARGGKGGRGNAALKTRLNPLPDHAEKGKPGEEKQLRLVLKVLADVGLVGRPNAGKSTLLSKISAAQPKIADYPFTTTMPYLGIVRCMEYQSFVVADIPGLIEGSHTGKGLGIRFLKHIERTSVLAVLVPADSPDPLAEAGVLLRELEAYSPLLAKKPLCFILSKSDLLTKETISTVPSGWFPLSAVTGEGIREIIFTLKAMVDAAAAGPSSAPGGTALS